MTVHVPELPVSPSEMHAMLRDLRDEAIQPVLPVLIAAGCLMMASSARFQDPLRGILPGLVLYGVAILVWALRGWKQAAARWMLVAGCAIADLIVVEWTGVDAALFLLALPAGLAALSISAAGGTVTAALCTPLVFLVPLAPAPFDSALRIMAAIGLWGTVGLIWLATRPLLTTLEWSWSSHERSRRLLESNRDQQVRLKQTVADLADANLQLTRLNRLAQGLRQAAEEARRAKEQFVANVSHELRTPLNMVIGFSEMILQAPQTYGHNLPPALLADLAVILRNSQHLSSLIDDVLDLSQIEAGQVALTKEAVAVQEIIEAAVIAVRPLFESKGLRLQVDVAEGLPPIVCDCTRIREVVLNLLSNAGRFTEHGGVQLRAWQQRDDLVVSVADTGPGIAAEDMGRIFQPFQQLDGSIRRRHGGSGLGLAVSKSFVELHGGKMWLESEKGRGTTVFFRLPVGPVAPADGNVSRWFNLYWHHEERTGRSLAPTPTVRPRFVILERGNALLHLLARYNPNVEVVAVTSLEKAIAELARVPARALLVNRASVEEALRDLDGATAVPYGTPVIACSLPGASEAAGALGVSDYLVKPVSRDRLLGSLDRLHLRGETVLLVDDEPEALRLFLRMFSSARRRYRVLRATDGQQALAILRQQHPDVVLLDLLMPGMDGFRFLEAKSQDPALRDIPVVVISARDPAGQPVVSKALAVTRAGGLSTHQLLTCIEGLSQTLSLAGLPADPAPLAESAGE